MVLRAGEDSPEARAALAELCEAYWEPVFRFLRREGRDQDLARELAQDFFARLLAGSGVTGANPARGRFRSYLLGALRHFLADRRDRERRLKRGAGIPLQSLDGGPADTNAPSAPEVPDPAGPVSDALFDRAWAVTIMNRALHSVAAGFSTGRKSDHFRVLKPWLVGDACGRSQADAARELGLTEGAVKVAVHRLRKHFREAVRAEIAQTLPEGGDVEAELRYLAEVLAFTSRTDPLL